jgi:hypothetical protein
MLLLMMMMMMMMIDGDGDDDDLTSIWNTTHSKNDEHILLSQLKCRFFNV